MQRHDSQGRAHKCGCVLVTHAIDRWREGGREAAISQKRLDPEDGRGAMIGENRQLVTDEPVEVHQDCRKIDYRPL